MFTNQSQSYPSLRSIKKRIWSKSFDCLLLGPKGYDDCVVQEARRVLDDHNINRDDPRGVTISNLAFRQMLTLPLQLGTIRDAYWIFHAAKLDKLSALTKHLEKIPWNLLFDAEIFSQNSTLNLRVDSFHSRLFHEGKLRDMILEFLGSQGIAIRHRDEADHRIWLQLRDNYAYWGLSLAGKRGFYQRGYKTALTHDAPLPEHLASCLVQNHFSRYPLENAYDTIVPFAGSGTLGFEHFLIRNGGYCQRWRQNYGLDNLACTPVETLNHTRQVLRSRSDEAVNHQDLGKTLFIELNQDNMNNIRQNLVRFAAGFSDSSKVIQSFECLTSSVFDVAPLRLLEFKSKNTAFVPLNPPYGNRLGTMNAVRGQYQSLAQWLTRLPYDQISGFCLCPDQDIAAAFVLALKGWQTDILASYHGGSQIWTVSFSFS